MFQIIRAKSWLHIDVSQSDWSASIEHSQLNFQKIKMNKIKTISNAFPESTYLPIQQTAFNASD